MLSVLSLAVVGAQYANPKKMPARRFGIQLCAPCDPVELRLEPENPVDPRAVAVYCADGIKLGYITAERCGFIGRQIREGRQVDAVFQKATQFGAIIRVAFDGAVPLLPVEPRAHEDQTDDEPVFYPDYEPDYESA